MKNASLPLSYSLIAVLALVGFLYYASETTEETTTITADDKVYFPHYKEMMADPAYNVYDVIDAGNAWFKDRDRGKGSGYKQFQRWILMNEDRFYPSGDRSAYNPLLPYEVRGQYETTDPAPAGEPTFAGLHAPVMLMNTWEEVGPAVELKRFYDDVRNGNGRVDAIWIDPADANHIYVGNRGGGFWTTADGGNTWVPKTDMLGLTGVVSMAVNPANPDEVFIATSLAGAGAYTIGIFRTLNAGDTWTPTGYALDIAMDFTRIAKVLMHPTDPTILFAATNKGLVKTTDGFQTFSTVLTGAIDDVEFKPGDPLIMYAANDTDNTLYRSVDGGDTFVATSVTNVSDPQVAVSAAAPNNVYVAGDDYFSKSIDDGLTFVQGGSPDGGTGQYGGFSVSDTDPDLIVNGSLDTYRSTDGGLTFTKVTNWIYSQSSGIGGNFVHADIREVEFQNGVLYLGTDGWLVRSTDGGLNYDALTFTMGNHEIYRHGIGVSQADDNTLVIGVQDNGSSVWYDGVWHHWKGGDGGTSLADHATKDMIYGSLFNGDFKRSPTAGKVNDRIDLGDTKPGGLPPMIQHPTESATLFLGEGNGQIWKSTNRGDSWIVLHDLGVSEVVDELAIAPSDPDVILASVRGRIWKTTDGGANWTEITGTLPNRVIHGIAIDYDDPTHFAVAMAGYGAGEKAYESTNGGTSWTNISTGLPNLNTNDIVFQNAGNDGLFLASDIGVYYRTTGAWALYGTGLPNCLANDLEIQHATNKLYVATWGRGVWSVDMPAGRTPPVTEFSADQTSINLGSMVTFTDASTNAPTSWAWTFPSGTPAMSTDQNPTVTYNVPGVHEVSLTTTNADGSDTRTKIGYITVSSDAVLQVHYEFDGNGDDASTYQRDATLGGTATYETGVLGQAIELIGGAPLINVTGYKGEQGAGPRSVVTWIKTSGDASIASWGGTGTANRFTFRLDGGRPRVEIAGSFVVGTTDIADGQWHQVAFSFTEDATPTLDNVTFYVDGQPDARSSIGSLINVNTTEGSDVSIGSFAFGGELTGLLDEFRMYNVALTATEVNDLFTAIPTPPFCPGDCPTTIDGTGLVSDFPYDNSLEDAGTNGVDVVANYSPVVYTTDRENVASSAWDAPENTTDYLTVECYKGISGNSARTVSAWILVESGGTRKTIVSWGVNSNGEMFNVMVEGGEIRVEAGGSNYRTSGANLEDGNWHHIAYTFDPADGGELQDGTIYVDGQAVTNTTNFNGSRVINTASGSDVLIGAAIYDSDYFFRGSLDDVRIYDSALSATEVLAEYCQFSGATNCLLPVDFLHFAARQAGKTVRLNWETTATEHNAGFTVERSERGVNWSLLKTIAPFPADEAQRYEAVDEFPLSGTGFYRIVQTDFDGTRTYSVVREVSFGDASGKLTVAPNPSTGILHVGLPAGIELTAFDIINTAGRVVSDGVPQNLERLDLSSLAAGVYTIRVVAVDGTVYTRKVVLR